MAAVYDGEVPPDDAQGEPGARRPMRDPAEVTVTSRSREERYRTFFGLSSEGIWCSEYRPPIDVSLPAAEQARQIYERSVVVECNEGFARAYAVDSAEEVIGRHLSEFFNMTPEWLAMAERYVLAGYEITNGESREELPDGSVRFYLNNAFGVVEDGRLIETWGTEREISEIRRSSEALRQSEQLLSDAESLAALGSFREDLASGHTEWSEQLYRLLGYEPGELTPAPGVLGAHLHPDDQERAERDRAALLAGAEPKEHVYRLRSRNKELLTVRCSALVESDEEGRPQRLRGIVQDISERVREEQARQELEEQLHQAQKMDAVGQLAAGIAHDFNNLLQAIAGYTEICQSECDLGPGIASDSLEEILRATERAAALTRQLLTFSRKHDLNREAIEFAGLVDDLLRMLRPLLGERVEVVRHFEGDLWAVDGDRSQIEQILVNLCVNACDAMPEGGRLSIGAENVRLDEDACRALPEAIPGPYLKLQVRDEGCGIPDAIKDRVFDPFFTSKGVGQGSGLGLSVVYAIVQRHRGAVSLESEVGEGTTVTIHLPACEP